MSAAVAPQISITLQESSPASSPSNSGPLSQNSPAPITPLHSRADTSFGSQHSHSSSQADWGSNFWVTLVDPQTQVSFYACPATGEVSWDPPVGHFVLPPSEEGEWWELVDESRNLPYYYHTKSGETVWERPDAFVIPLGVLQNTTLGRRLSTSFRNSRAYDQNFKVASSSSPSQQSQSPSAMKRRSRSYTTDRPHTASTTPTRQSPGSAGKTGGRRHVIRRSLSSDQYQGLYSGDPRLPPIPASPYSTDVSSIKSAKLDGSGAGERNKDGDGGAAPQRALTQQKGAVADRDRSKPPSSYHRPPLPQNLDAAVELLTTQSSSPSPTRQQHSFDLRVKTSLTPTFLDDLSGSAPPTPNPNVALAARVPSTPTGSMPPTPREPGKGWKAFGGNSGAGRANIPPSPRRPAPVPPGHGKLAGKEISGPVLNQEATMNLSPVKNRAAGRPIPVEPRARPGASTASLNSYPLLPHDLASDIQQFIESEFARQYFSTHRTGFIFKRKVPVAQMMSWQKAPLTAPLLVINRGLQKDAVKIFKVVQRIMGDRDRDRPVGVRTQEAHVSTVASINNGAGHMTDRERSGLLEEERWLLGEGLAHGELRDEIYCQVMKQLSRNPNPESVFKGWQLMCVLLITFPPSKDFERYLQSFIQQRTTQAEGRVDVMAKYCLRRLAYISKKGPRGKPPSTSEIEVASDAAFNPSIFGESLDIIFRLQQRTYPQAKVPIILPFLADGILALGGTKSEGIFRVPGDGDSVAELKLRLDQGYYTLDGVDDPHVLSSLLKLWLRELLDPLVPDELYNDCISHAKDAEACVGIVQRLPTINRRVVLFVISFLQLFLEEKVMGVTKMTSANLALVMAPNLLRCSSESMAIVFTNAQYEQHFVHNLLLHLKCNTVDPDYVPQHGLGAIQTAPPPPRMSKTRSRRS